MAGTASFFQTWPREGRRLRHLRCPGPPLPRSARARPRPPEPGHPRGLPATTTTPAPRKPRRPPRLPAPAPRAGVHRKAGLGEPRPPPRPSPFLSRPGAREARPGPQRAPPGMAARRLGRPGPAGPRTPGGCKHGSQRYTTPPPSRAAGHTHTRSSGKDPGGQGAQSLLPPTPPPSPDGRGGPRAPKS